jgi:cytochrome b involved in lipid metabolism
MQKFDSLKAVQDFAFAHPDRLIVTWKKNKVLDLTEYANEHPGGPDVLTDCAGGKDITEFFEAIGHSNSALKRLESLIIAEIEPPKPVTPVATKAAAAATQAAPPTSVLSIAAFVAFVGFFFTVAK